MCEALLGWLAGIEGGQIAHVFVRQVSDHTRHDRVGAGTGFVFHELLVQVIGMLSGKVRVCAQRAIAIHPVARRAHLSGNAFAFGGVAEFAVALLACAVPRGKGCNRQYRCNQ